MRPSAPLLLALLLAARAGAAEPAQPAWSSVRLEGCAAFSERALCDTVGLERWSPLRPFHTLAPVPRERLEAQVEDLVQFYRRQGYFEVRAEVVEAGGGGAIVKISEGNPTRVTSIGVEVEGESPPELAPGALRAGLPLHEGDVFSVDGYEAVARDLERRFKEQGFPFAAATPSADADLAARRATLLYRVVPGERLSFGETKFEGLVHAEEAVLRRALAWREGKLYRQSWVDQTAERLLLLGLFDSVAVEPATWGGGTIHMRVRVVEGRQRMVKAGVGYGSDDGPRFRFGWETLRFLGRTCTAGTDVSTSDRADELSAYVRRPYPWDGRSRLSAETTFGRRRETDFTYRSLDAKVGVDQGFGAGFRAGLYVRLERVLQVTPDQNLRRALAAGASRVDTISSVILGISYDRSDDPIEPTRGYRGYFSVEPSHALGSGADFTRYLLEGRLYTRAPRNSVGAFRLRLGAIEGEPPEGIPLSRRFYAGGSQSLRGYRYDGLGPLGPDGALLGGNALAEASAELRIPLTKTVQGVVFTDAGNAFPKAWTFSGAPYYWNAGVGARLRTPVGPIGMDLAYRLRTDPRDSGRFAVHFYIGYAF